MVQAPFICLAMPVIGLRFGNSQTSLEVPLTLHQWCFCWAFCSLCLRSLCDVPTTISLKLSLTYCCRSCIIDFWHKDSSSRSACKAHVGLTNNLEVLLLGLIINDVLLNVGMRPRRIGTMR